MLEETIEELTKLYIKENFDKTKKVKFIITKEELIKFCIKLVKVVKKIDES